jgi:hypothetical protein
MTRKDIQCCGRCPKKGDKKRRNYFQCHGLAGELEVNPNLNFMSVVEVKAGIYIRWVCGETFVNLFVSFYLSEEINYFRIIHCQIDDIHGKYLVL